MRADERVHAALAEERALAPVVRARQLPVHEHGQVELPREAVGDRQRLVLRKLAVLLAQVGDRHHVERADARMSAFVHAHVDVLDHRARRRQQRVGELLRAAHQREDAAVVVGVGVDVQQAAPVRAERARRRRRCTTRRDPR